MGEQITEEGRLAQLVASVGGPDELVALVEDYRRIVGALASAKDARSVMPDVRCWLGRKNLLRVAADLPRDKGAAFLGVWS